MNRFKKNKDILLQNIKEIKWIIFPQAFVIGFVSGLLGWWFVLGVPTALNYGDVSPSDTGVFIFMLMFGAGGAAYYAGRVALVHKFTAAMITMVLYFFGMLIIFCKEINNSSLITGSVLGLLFPIYVVYQFYKHGDKFRIGRIKIFLFMVLIFIGVFLLQS